MIDRSRLSAEFRAELDERNAKTKARRELAKSLGLCINGPLPGASRARPTTIEHGPPIGESGRCQRCVDARTRNR